ncbi:hypothetical protein AB1Y20_008280 [Prymnesium parvum]|uniref:Cyclic nucleotide-binding domain-containing protein n=1 Tax=Prymnesium parvum TaxID=97485 RepID=A0AB34ITW2_PRYPA
MIPRPNLETSPSSVSPNQRIRMGDGSVALRPPMKPMPPHVEGMPSASRLRSVGEPIRVSAIDPEDDGCDPWSWSPINSLRRSFESVRERQFIFDNASAEMWSWNWVLGFLAVYNAVYSPLALAFPSIRWNGDDLFGYFVDVLFSLDVLIKLRTLYHDRGYAVTGPVLVMRNYLSSSFKADVIGALPFDQFLMLFVDQQDHETLLWCGAILRLLRIRRCRKLMRQMDRSWNINVTKVVALIASFILLAHWFGLAFTSLAIRPLIRSGDTSYPWWWLSGQPEQFVGHLYVCGVYWALTVMTNLKPLSGTEARNCYYATPLTQRPIEERVFTICVFLVGALVFSTIYGNIQIFVSRMNKINDRFSNRMFEVNEFIAFHGLSNTLATKIRNYVEFSFLATKGINVDYISDQLPPYLQVQITLQLNRRVVESVKIFAGCPRDFIQSLVFKLVPSICVVGDNIVSEGELGDCLYFIRRGIAEVIVKGNKVVATLHEGDYFGEMALIRQEKRTADVRASTDCMLLSLSHDDLEEALEAFPHIRMRIEAAASERLMHLKRTDMPKAVAPHAHSQISSEICRTSRGSIAALIDAPAHSPRLSSTSPPTHTASSLIGGFFGRVSRNRVSPGDSREAIDGGLSDSSSTETHKQLASEREELSKSPPPLSVRIDEAGSAPLAADEAAAADAQWRAPSARGRLSPEYRQRSFRQGSFKFGSFKLSDKDPAEEELPLSFAQGQKLAHLVNATAPLQRCGSARRCSVPMPPSQWHAPRNGEWHVPAEPPLPLDVLPPPAEAEKASRAPNGSGEWEERPLFGGGGSGFAPFPPSGGDAPPPPPPPPPAGGGETLALRHSDSAVGRARTPEPALSRAEASAPVQRGSRSGIFTRREISSSSPPAYKKHATVSTDALQSREKKKAKEAKEAAARPRRLSVGAFVGLAACRQRRRSSITSEVSSNSASPCTQQRFLGRVRSTSSTKQAAEERHADRASTDLAARLASMESCMRQLASAVQRVEEAEEKDRKDRELRERSLHAKLDRMGNILARMAQIRSTWE